MNWKWFSVQFVWVSVKLIVVLLLVGTVALLPIGAGVASLGVIALAAKGYLSFKVALILLFILFLIQGVWLLKWGEGLSIISPYI